MASFNRCLSYNHLQRAQDNSFNIAKKILPEPFASNLIARHDQFIKKKKELDRAAKEQAKRHRKPLSGGTSSLGSESTLSSISDSSTEYIEATKPDLPVMLKELLKREPPQAFPEIIAMLENLKHLYDKDTQRDFKDVGELILLATDAKNIGELLDKVYSQYKVWYKQKGLTKGGVLIELIKEGLEKLPEEGQNNLPKIVGPSRLIGSLIVEELERAALRHLKAGNGKQNPPKETEENPNELIQIPNILDSLSVVEDEASFDSLEE